MPFRTDTVESAARTLRLLEELNRHRVASLDALHRATALPKSTLVRLLKSLCALGYVANDRRQGGYAITSRVKSLSMGFRGDPLVVEAARPFAIAFTRQHQWPVAIAVRDGLSVAIRFGTIPDGPVSPFRQASVTIAVPIVFDDKVLATAGMTYFKSAVRPEEIAARYVPLVAALGRNIATSVQ